MTINQLLTDEQIHNNETHNRLYLMLGYSLLNNQYFRESRESFRNISIDSQYANRAMMGLALAAMNQDDSLSALNLLLTLNKETSHELVVEETYILLPHLYQKLKRYKTASDAYDKAISYYNKRIKLLNSVLNMEEVAKPSLDMNGEITLGNTLFKLSDIYSVYFLHNRENLSKLIKHINSPLLLEKVNSLISEYDDAAQIIMKQKLAQRADILNSYLNQSIYGLAQLYDNANE
jgi:tetratricopeptide (TPR) repeat protein